MLFANLCSVTQQFHESYLQTTKVMPNARYFQTSFVDCIWRT